MKIIQVTHYAIDDPDHIGDYIETELLDEDGTVIASYGDSYHDKGKEKAEGFIEGVKWHAGEEVEVEHRLISDRDI